MHLLDVNVLIALADSDHSDHEAASPESMTRGLLHLIAGFQRHVSGTGRKLSR
jgi:hypothetical protein